MLSHKRISKGLYEVHVNGRKFDIDQDSYGLWQVFEVGSKHDPNAREYLQDYSTKREAIYGVEQLIRNGY